MFIARGSTGKASVQRHLSHMISKTTPYQRSSFTSSCLRSAAPAAKSNPTRAQASNAKGRLVLPTNRPGLTAAQSRAGHHAEKMFEAGMTELYRAPSHFWYLLGSWVLGISCLTGAAGLIWLGHWKEDKESGLPFFVPVGYQLSIITTTGFAAWILLRSARLVTAIDLVKHAREGKMRVCVSRIVPLPFIPPRRIYISPYNLRIPRSANRPLEVPAYARMPQEDSSKPLRFGSWAARKISFSLWRIFASQRKILTQDGFFYATIKGQWWCFKIDLEGTFPNGSKNLVDVSSREED